MYTPPEELKKMVDDAIADPDLKQYPYLVHLLQYPKKNPILFDFMLHKLDGPYYWERSVSERLDKINVPCYVGGPFFSFFSQPQMNVFNRVNVPKKMYLYTDMGTRPWRANHDELLRWYDYWLKGIDTGIMDEPTIRYQTTGMTTWQSGETWPLETTQWTDFYFNSLEQLGAAPDFWNEEPDAFVQQPLYVTEKRSRVTYVSPPLPYDLQVTGPPRITFYADIDQDDTCWRVEVREADSDAIYPLASGWLKASHRSLDDAKTTAWEIAHDHTKEVPIVPGESQRVRGAAAAHVASVQGRQADQGGDLLHRHPHRHRDVRCHVACLQEQDVPAQDLSRRPLSLSGVPAGHSEESVAGPGINLELR